jgi:hypothetical protein
MSCDRSLARWRGGDRLRVSVFEWGLSCTRPRHGFVVSYDRLPPGTLPSTCLPGDARAPVGRGALGGRDEYEQRFESLHGFWRGVTDNVIGGYLDCGFLDPSRSRYAPTAGRNSSSFGRPSAGWPRPWRSRVRRWHRASSWVRPKNEASGSSTHCWLLSCPTRWA